MSALLTDAPAAAAAAERAGSRWIGSRSASTASRPTRPSRTARCRGARPPWSWWRPSPATASGSATATPTPPRPGSSASCSPAVVGRDALDVPAAWEAMAAAMRNLGRPGIVALGDRRGRHRALGPEGAPPRRLAGRAAGGRPRRGRRSTAAAASPRYDDERLREQLGGWAAEGSAGEDEGGLATRPTTRGASAWRARRSVAGVALFVDANGAYSRKQALALAESFAQERRRLVRGAGQLRRPGRAAPGARPRARRGWPSRRASTATTCPTSGACSRRRRSTCCRPTRPAAPASPASCAWRRSVRRALAAALLALRAGAAPPRRLRRRRTWCTRVLPRPRPDRADALRRGAAAARRGAAPRPQPAGDRPRAAARRRGALRGGGMSAIAVRPAEVHHRKVGAAPEVDARALAIDLLNEVDGEVRFDAGVARPLRHRRLELPAAADRRGGATERGGRRAGDRRRATPRRAAGEPRRWDGARRADLQRRPAPRLQQVRQPDRGAGSGGAARARGAGDRPRRAAQRRGEASPHLRPGPGDARPLHPGRDARQQQLRRPLGDGRQDR